MPHEFRPARTSVVSAATILRHVGWLYLLDDARKLAGEVGVVTRVEH